MFSPLEHWKAASFQKRFNFSWNKDIFQLNKGSKDKSKIRTVDILTK